MKKMLTLAVCAVFVMPIRVSLSNDAISQLIASSFLRERKIAVRTDAYWKDCPLEQQIFGKTGSEAVQFYNVWIYLRREADRVILTIDVLGAPEEFRGKNVLANEKVLLKHVLIGSYLAKVNNTRTAHAAIVTVLDSKTKALHHPRFGWVTENGKRRRTEDEMWLSLRTVFTMAEFKNLIAKYFVDAPTAS
jgi:hypothetical protein